MRKCKNCSRVCIIVHNCHTQQHRAALIIFRLILQTSTRAQIRSIRGEGKEHYNI